MDNKQVKIINSVTDLIKIFRKTPLLLCLFSIGYASCKKAGVAPPGANNTNKGKYLVLTSLDEQKVTADNAFSLRLFKNPDRASAGNALTLFIIWRKTCPFA